MFVLFNKPQVPVYYLLSGGCQIIYIYIYIYNCCLSAFLREVLINYVSNMIRIRLNNCTNFWKQKEFFHGFDNLQKLVSVGAIRRFIFSIFANQSFSRDIKAELLRKSIAVVLQVKFRFMSCLVKANALISGNKNHHRYHHS